MRKYLIMLALFLINYGAFGQNSRLIEESFYFYSSGYKPFDSIKFTYQPSLGGDLTHKMKFDTDTTYQYSSSWNPLQCDSQVLDSKNNVIAIISKNFTAGKWINASETFYLYDAAGNVIGDTVKLWNTASSQFVNFGIHSYMYDPSGNLLSERIGTWDGAKGWANYELDSMAYSVSGDLIRKQVYYWDSSSTAYVNNEMDLYTYDLSHNRTSDSILIWDTKKLIWLNYSKDAYTYDGYKMITSDTTYSWDSASSTWSYTQLLVDSNDKTNLITQTSQNWNGSGFTKKNQYVYTYNSYNQPITYKRLSWDGSSFLAKNSDFEYFYYYENYTTGIHEEQLTYNLIIYPNPTTSKLTIKCTHKEALKLRLMNDLGQILLSKDFPESEQYLLLDNLKSGTYWVVLYNVNGKILNAQQIIKN